jgi:hypothetical protein
MKSISWNEEAVKQAKAQGLEDAREVTCPKCRTMPALRQFSRYSCECGELEGFAMNERF